MNAAEVAEERAAFEHADGVIARSGEGVEQLRASIEQALSDPASCTPGGPFQWPEGLRDRKAEALAQAREEAGAHIDEILAEQFFFDMQWKMLQVQCKDLTVRLLGDLPIYVDHDSVDVCWKTLL